MNIIDMVTRNDKRLVLGGAPRQVKLKHDRDIWRGLEFSDPEGPHVRVSGVGRVFRLQSLPTEIGWFVRLRKTSNDAPAPASAKGTVSLSNVGGAVSTREFVFSVHAVPVPMPWGNGQQSLDDGMEVGLSFDFPAGYVVEFLVQKVLDRESLLRFATGNGVEVGPGPRPQVHDSETTTVRYVEEMPIEQWKELYDRTGKYGTGSADFSKYIIGTADSIPAEKNSLNFIFSSHVFEHLANPLGHLIRWRDLLAPGGVVLAVIPEMHSTKDLVASPSTIEEIEGELAEDVWRPTQAHYERWLGFRGMNTPAQELMEKNSSIHVHFYDKENLRTLLDKAVREHGFSSHMIIHADNHKDFYFCLWK